MTIRGIIEELRRTLEPHVGTSEARAMSNIIVEDVKQYTPTQLLMYGDREILDGTADRIRGIAKRIVQGEPMQYVLGSARFRGRDFKVDPSVLIPRPETGQLVDMIVDDNSHRHDCRIMDIGTGSGCIAISLALDLPYARVYAIDISPAAIKTAQSNAAALRTSIHTTTADIFALSESGGAAEQFDVVVSNPPYILTSEADSMDPRVKDYEPMEALFVDDRYPIAIYEAIARYGKKHLRHGGRLYLELNPLCADAISNMLKGMGYDEVTIHRDYRGNKRFATATA